MKRIILTPLLFAGCLGLMSLAPENTVLSLENAIKNGTVSCTYKANPQSTHYVRPLIVSIRNLKNTPVTIKIDAGQQFFPSSAEYQNLIVTRAGNVIIKPNENKNVELFAMCTESSDAAPGGGTTYKLGPIAQGNLRKIAEYVAHEKVNNLTGQSAVWAISNNYAIDGIMGPDSAETRDLQKFVAKITGKRLPPPPAPNNYETNYYAPPRPDVSYSGSITMNIAEPTSLAVVLFNKNNVAVRELYNNSALAAGSHKISYAFDNSVYAEDVYYIRAIIDGQVKFNRKVEMKMN
ncbi:MAG: hypothetical protein EOP53_19735 [Sphingobacteriales bacterium]|nr:MAG: hypothetical protein EOP53_19735 [Sphingobacteriales bacterium]